MRVSDVAAKVKVDVTREGGRRSRRRRKRRMRKEKKKNGRRKKGRRRRRVCSHVATDSNWRSVSCEKTSFSAAASSGRPSRVVRVARRPEERVPAFEREHGPEEGNVSKDMVGNKRKAYLGNVSLNEGDTAGLTDDGDESGVFLGGVVDSVGEADGRVNALDVDLVLQTDGNAVHCSRGRVSQSLSG
jgi:hypothetical protein